jgi:methionine--tRNA ligase beta chain
MERPMITIEDFKKVELIIAQIKDVQDHPQADRLYLVKIDTGKEEKQLVAGIRPFYKKEDLIGRRVVVVNNLQPAVIRGQESQGMLLAATDEAGITILSVERDVALGSIVK